MGLLFFECSPTNLSALQDTITTWECKRFFGYGFIA